jgi:hypothetical protein
VTKEFAVRMTPMYRTLVALAYLLALVLHGRWDGGTAALALAVVAVWAVPVIRDARRSRSVVSAAVSAR